MSEFRNMIYRRLNRYYGAGAVRGEMKRPAWWNLLDRFGFWLEKRDYARDCAAGFYQPGCTDGRSPEQKRISKLWGPPHTHNDAQELWLSRPELLPEDDRPGPPFIDTAFDNV